MSLSPDSNVPLFKAVYLPVGSGELWKVYPVGGPCQYVMGSLNMASSSDVVAIRYV